MQRRNEMSGQSRIGERRGDRRAGTTRHAQGNQNHRLVERVEVHLQPAVFFGSQCPALFVSEQIIPPRSASEALDTTQVLAGVSGSY